jgi:N-acyl-D-amino-acid deacylase
MSAPKYWGKAQLLIDKLSQAKINGVDVSLDSYPYLAGMTYLHAFLPSWISEGGLKKAKERIENSDARAKLIHELKITGTDGNQGSPVNWTAVIIAHVNRPDNNVAIGMNLQQYADRVKKDVAEAYLDLIIDEDFESSCVIFAGNEENVRTIMQHENHMIGSDGILFGKRPHPRAWGTFARILGVYGRDEKVLTLEGAVARMTGRPAKRIGLTDRGFVKPNYLADLVVFDPKTVIDKSTYENPREPAAGIIHVFIDGQYVIKNSKRTDLVVGKSVRNPKHWSKS